MPTIQVGALVDNVSLQITANGQVNEAVMLHLC